MAQQEGYKVRKSKAGSRDHPYDAFSITIPAAEAAKIQRLDERRFQFRWTDAGFEFVEVTQNGDEGQAPEWAR